MSYATKPKEHQQRVVDKIMREDQPGLVVAHGLGSGKTYTSILAAKSLSGSTIVALPASLADNYRGELRKHVGNTKGFDIQSMQGIARRGNIDNSDTLIVDEAHRLRNAGGKTEQAIRDNGAKKRLLLTASPFYNNPAEIAPLVNIAAGREVLPQSPSAFMSRYTEEKRINPSLSARILHGAKSWSEVGISRENGDELKSILKKWVDYHPNSSDGFPDVERVRVEVPMSKHQQDIYDTAINVAPPWLKYKIRTGLPPSKTELGKMNMFMNVVRQISNSTDQYLSDGAPESPKADAIIASIKDKMATDKNYRGLVYSTYIGSGIEPMRDRLKSEGIKFGEYTGEMSQKSRDKLVYDYNNGKVKVMLLSSAAGEGLSLHGTKHISIMEPHFNAEKIKQVEGRGIRYNGHAHLPKAERKVIVESYVAVRSPASIAERMKIIGTGGSSDQYLEAMSDSKEKLNNKFRQLMSEEDGAK